MYNQKDLIRNTDYNNLVVLDGARYDYFKDYIQRFPIEGELSKAWSPAIGTGEWFETVWSDYYDMEVHSCQLGRPVRFDDGESYITDEHFKYIHNAREHRDRAFPQSVNKCVKDNYTGRKSMIKYLQPHNPGVGEVSLNIEPKQLSKEVIAKHVPDEVYRREYRTNIKEVMRVMTEVLPLLEGKTVITSDHGTLLGEDGLYFHAETMNEDGELEQSDHDLLHEVPWMVVDDVADLKMMSAEEVVELAYRKVLNREPDPEGFDNYVGLLKDREIERSELFNILAESEESDLPI